MRTFITLLTDFGRRDSYVAQMKGVIYSLCPRAAVVDLGHEIRPHAVAEAALFIAEAAPRFPRGTIHVVVVDPGVGTSRRPLAVSAARCCFICPDNGVLTLVLRGQPDFEARMIEGPTLGDAGHRISATFHGRDVFAPAAARLARGVAFRRIGPVVDDIESLDIPRAEDGARGIRGEIIHVDRFGNCITNISRSTVQAASPAAAGAAAVLEVHLPEACIRGVSSTYGDAEAGRAVALWGSSDLLEVAVNRGSAAARLGLKEGSPVRIEFLRT
jgi:S-adenosylmethionine hydrolase